jgi:hypothetical protein
MLITAGLAALFATQIVGAFQKEPVDLDGINKIKAIGLGPDSSKVMEIASYLTDVYGPRLTGSPNIKRAGDWTVAQMKAWGLENVALEPWPADGSGQNGGFPCGWDNEKFYLSAVSPQAFPIRGTPTAWTPGTSGLVRGEVVYVPTADNTKEAIEEKFPAGKLKGKWIVAAAAPDVTPYLTAPGNRYTPEQLDRMENPPPPDPNAPARGGRQGQQGGRAGAPPAGAPPAGQAVAATPTPAPAAGRAATTPTPTPTPAPRKDVCAGKPATPEYVKAQADARAAAAAANPAGAGAQGQGAGGGGNRGGGQGGAQNANAFNRNEYFRQQGVLGIFTTAPRGHGIYTIGGGGVGTDPATKLPSIAIAAEDYGRIFRMITKGVPVIVEADIKNTFTPNPPMFNVVGEIRGTDKADEVVMLGAHFDSWHAATGATDNAAGSAAMLEAMRILKTSGVKLRRTVRIGLWTGEEQGLIGSNKYVAAHFGGGRGGRGGAAPTPPTAEHAKFAGYFNIDNGTGAIRGVYLQGNAAVGPIFKAWMEPFKSLGMTNVTISNTGGTDHQSYDGVGLPGFQFIQDEIEYNAITHHTNLDSYERLQAEDMRKNATIAAAFAFLTANRADLLPRKPPATGGRGGGQ